MTSRTATLELQNPSVFHQPSSKQTTDDHQREQDAGSQLQISSEEPSLPPVDRGKDAWLFLAACWVVEAVTFGDLLPKLCHAPPRGFTEALLTRGTLGFGFSFGIFQDYYSSHEPFSSSKSIAVIGTTTSVS